MGLSILCASLWAGGLLFAAGPFDPDQWPSVADPNKVAHDISTDGGIAPLGAGWSDTLSILSGGDQLTSPITLRGHQGLKVVDNYLNPADTGFPEWADNGTIDILMQVYGDGAVLGGNDQPRNCNFLIGALLPVEELRSSGARIRRSATVPERPVAMAPQRLTRGNEFDAYRRSDALRLVLRTQPRSENYAFA